MMYHDMDMNGWWMLWMGLMMLVFWGGIAGLVFWVTRSLISHEGDQTERPLDIAERRYARGEITREEFRKIQTDLTGRS